MTCKAVAQQQRCLRALKFAALKPNSATPLYFTVLTGRFFLECFMSQSVTTAAVSAGGVLYRSAGTVGVRPVVLRFVADQSSVFHTPNSHEKAN
jgi:hypothetical protein